MTPCCVRLTQEVGIEQPVNKPTVLSTDSSDTDNRPKYEVSKRGKILLGVFGGLFVGVYAITIPFISPALRRLCLPFVPATTQQVANVFTALGKRSGTLIDIGSGDGRIVLEAARRGFIASGVELNFWLIIYSQWTAWRHNLLSKTSYIRQDLWKTPLGAYDNIVIFGVEAMMPQLQKKFVQELPEGINIVACRFPLPKWKPTMTIGSGVDTVWLYVKKT